MNRPAVVPDSVQSARMVKGGTAEKQKRPSKAPEPTLNPNILEAFCSALQDSKTISDKLKALVISGSRHGDLQVTLSAIRRLEAKIKLLIDAEETTS